MEMSNDLLVQVLLVIFFNAYSDTIFFKIANFFDINDLMEIITQKIANMAKDKTTEQLRKVFMLPDDLTPDEKEAIRQKHEWASIPMHQ